jgi:tryptophan synthase beta chain
MAPTLPTWHIILMNLCGRGDKDVFSAARYFGIAL